MLHIDKFEYLRLISTLLQKLRADTVGDKRGHPLLQQSIAQNRLEQPVTYLAVQLMLDSPLLIWLFSSCWQHGTDRITSAPHLTAFAIA